MIKKIIAVVMISLVLTGCNEKTEVTDAFEFESYINELKYLIENGISENSDIYTDEFKFSYEDLSECDINEYYAIDNAIYLQVNDKYMYRFQLNDNKKIDAYIKYSLER